MTGQYIDVLLEEKIRYGQLKELKVSQISYLGL